MGSTAIRRIWLWQNIVSPHMAGLAVGLARRGCEVVYVAAESMSSDRREQGWSPASLDGVHLELVPTPESVKGLIDLASPNSIHICPGFRGRGVIGMAQKSLANRQFEQWIVMETVDDAGWSGILKRLEYKRMQLRWRDRIQGVLAIGHSTSAWLAARGAVENRVFPFAYFLHSPSVAPQSAQSAAGKFRILFVGQFIALKRLDWLIGALARLPDLDFELAVVGSGPFDLKWKTLAETALPGRVDWIGRLPIEEIPAEMSRADCLVLPSRHDGWGAVVSEAMMVGTPVICSDACGSAAVVRSSNCGGVFPSGNCDLLVRLLERSITRGRVTPDGRASLVAWARCLGEDAGAAYLLGILDYAAGDAARPVPPWEASVHARNIREYS